MKESDAKHVEVINDYLQLEKIEKMFACYVYLQCISVCDWCIYSMKWETVAAICQKAVPGAGKDEI